jgi:hypothetical protein
MERELLILKFKRDIEKRSRIQRFLLVFDQMCNVVFWNGSQDETISSHIGRLVESGKATWFDNAICFILKKMDSNHCFRSRGE